MKSKFMKCNRLIQVMGTLVVTLWHLNDGACVSISSTILYSLERGSEGIKESLEEAILVRTLFQYNFVFLVYLHFPGLYIVIQFSNSLPHWQHYWIFCKWLDIFLFWTQTDHVLVWASSLSYLACHRSLSKSGRT